MIAKLEWMLTKESPQGYQARRDFIYEVVLKTAGGDPWLGRPENAQRVLQVLLLVQKMLELEWLDILLWQDGIYLRLKLGQATNLSEVLALLREKTSPGDRDALNWEDEPTWVRMVTPERAGSANRLLWEKINSLLGALERMPEDPSSLFFYHGGGTA
jgi:hypothetical protein